MERQLSKPFTVVIQLLSTRLIKPNFFIAGSAKPLSTRLIAYRFRVSVPHRRDTTVSLEIKPFIDLSPLLTGYFGALESYGHRVYDNRDLGSENEPSKQTHIRLLVLRSKAL